MFGKLKLLILSKISLQILIFFVFIALVSVNSIWFFPVLSKIKQDVASLQLETANRARDEVSNFISGHIDEFERISDSIAVSENKEFFLDTLFKDDDVQQIVLADKTGKEIFKIHRYRKIYSEDLKDRFNEKGFSQVLSGGENYIGPVFTENLEPMLNIIIPLKASELKIDGVLEVTLNLKSLWKKVGELKVGTKGLVYIINTNGVIIAHKNPGVVLSGTYVLNKEIVRRLIFEKEIVDGSGPESRYFDIDDNEVFGVGVPFGILGWGIIVEQPWKEAFAARTKIISLAGITFGLSVVLLLLLQIVIGKLIKTTSELTKKYRQLELQKNELDKTAKMLIRRDFELSETREKRELELKKLAESRVALMNILEDIDESRKKAEEEKNKTLAIITNFTDGILVFDKENNLSLINPQAELFFGVKSENVVGQPILELTKIPGLESLVSLLGEEIKKVFRKELQIKKDLILEVSTILILRERERLGTLIILHDVSREKKIEEMKTEFVSISAHQLRTPLSAIKWTLRMLLDGDLGKITKEQREFIDKTYRSNERMIGLINDLLNVTRIEEGKYLYNPILTDFEPVVQSVIGFYKEEIEKRKIKFEFRKPEKKLPKVLIDVGNMEIAINSLLDNAIRYTRPGGIVTISLNCGKKEIEFSIKDTGVGIPKDGQKRVFSRFFRAANAIRMETEGSGLGLYITKNIIEAHGGKIWFESEENKGTIFNFTIPIKEPVKDYNPPATRGAQTKVWEGGGRVASR